jgi:hypothetical protein
VRLHYPIYGTVAYIPYAEVLNSPFAVTRREGGSTADACVCNAGLGYGDRDFVPGCAPCGPGTISRHEDPEEYSEPSSVRVDCLQGQYTDLAGLVACKTCLVHASSYEHPRVSCQCDAGYTFDNYTARMRQSEDHVSGICSACEERMFKNEHGDHECSACPAHSLGSPSESIAVTSCQCDPRFFGADGGNCTECPVNTYSSEIGSASCKLCPANTVSESVLVDCRCDDGYTGQDGIACTACEIGKYKDAVGSAMCTACAVGKYLTATGTNTPDDCVNCDAGTYSTIVGASVAETAAPGAPPTRIRRPRALS